MVETLFSLEPLRRHFTAAGMPDGTLETWFATALRDMFAMSASGNYAPMQTVLEAALEEIGAKQSGRVDRTNLVRDMGTLPPHPDVVGGVVALANAGFRLAAVTNGSKEQPKNWSTAPDLRQSLKN